MNKLTFLCVFGKLLHLINPIKQTYIYIYIYIYTYLVRHGNRQDVFFYGFRRRHHPTFLFYGFRRWFVNGFRRGRERFLMVSVVVFLMASGCYRTAAVSPMEMVKKKHQDVSVTN